ncbi:MAG TPA: hypothetical protein VJV78_23630 [Polyangiales bacterium]|nr:hypothetical protein [Polyangiales bacterium]
MADIATTYNPKLTVDAGFFNAVTEDQDRPIGENGKTLLHLLFWLTYTKLGREFLAKNHVEDAEPTGPRIEAIRAALREEFLKFNVDNEVVVTALTDAHLAAEDWVKANTAGSLVERDKFEAIYKQNMSVVTWWLWEESLGNNFSLLW